jgi:hypothetical protein
MEFGIYAGVVFAEGASADDGYADRLGHDWLL